MLMPEMITPNKVRFTPREVSEFIKSFPCSGLRERSYWFEFESNGDLVDTDVPQHDDGAGASALAEMAREYWESEKC
jgi:hypothetical protein